MDAERLDASAALHALDATAAACGLVDGHAHPFRMGAVPRLQAVLSEGADAHGTLAFCRAVREVAELLHVDAGELAADGGLEEAVERARAGMGADLLAEKCFAAAGVAAVLLDDGFCAREESAWAGLEAFEKLGVSAWRVERLEVVAERVLTGMMGKGGRIGEKTLGKVANSADFIRAFQDCIDPLPEGVVAFKSIAAYRSGLAVHLSWTEEDVDDALSRLACIGGPVRLEDPVLVDTVVRVGFEVARRHDIPIQFHCGFGDTDLDLPKADPTLLRPLFRTYPDVRIVLLHAAWPFTRNAAYLTSVYPAVFLDLGMAIPLLSVCGMRCVLNDALEIAPITKLLYSSDAHSAPDVFYLAARWGRRVVPAAIAAAYGEGDLSIDEAKAAVRKILCENAEALYKLPIAH